MSPQVSDFIEAMQKFISATKKHRFYCILPKN